MSPQMSSGWDRPQGREGRGVGSARSRPHRPRGSAGAFRGLRPPREPPRALKSGIWDSQGGPGAVPVTLELFRPPWHEIWGQGVTSQLHPSPIPVQSQLPIPSQLNPSPIPDPSPIPVPFEFHPRSQPHPSSQFHPNSIPVQSQLPIPSQFHPSPIPALLKQPPSKGTQPDLKPPGATSAPASPPGSQIPLDPKSHRIPNPTGSAGSAGPGGLRATPGCPRNPKSLGDGSLLSPLLCEVRDGKRGGIK